MVHLLPFFVKPCNSKSKSKPSGLPDSNFIFFVATKKTKQKKAFTLRWACLAREGGNLNSERSCRTKAYASPAGDEALESLSFCGELQRWPCFQAFPCRLHPKEGPPVTGRLLEQCRLLISQNPGKGDALRKEQGVFAYFCRRMDKSKASGGTRPAGLAFKINDRGHQMAIWCPGLFHSL